MRGSWFETLVVIIFMELLWLGYILQPYVTGR